jgi:ribonucleoside-diphosphate reductase alpha chain
MSQKNKQLEPQTFSYEEVWKDTLDYCNQDEFRSQIIIEKYLLQLLKEEKIFLERSPQDMFDRIISSIMGKSDVLPHKPLQGREVLVRQALERFKWISLSGGFCFGLGNNNSYTSLSNCFGLPPVEDSYAGILTTDEQIVQICKRRGGYGFDISKLRPKGASTNNAALCSSGAVSFLSRFSNSTNEVAQEGRRGAGWIGMISHHPDIQEFIEAKADPSKNTGVNTSVMFDEQFFGAIEQDKEYALHWGLHDFSHVNPNELLEQFIHASLNYSCPGSVFLPNIRNGSPAESYSLYKFAAFNPCGEQPLEGYGSCLLLAINLFACVDNPFTKEATFNQERFEQITDLATRIGDVLVDLEIDSIQRIINKLSSESNKQLHLDRERQLWQNILATKKLTRRIGVELLGIHDTVAALYRSSTINHDESPMVFGDGKSIVFCQSIAKQLALCTYRTSVQLAKEKTLAAEKALYNRPSIASNGYFPSYRAETEANNPYLERLFSVDPQLKADHAKYGRANLCLMSLAPTGTRAILAGTSSGIEPAFGSPSKKMTYTRYKRSQSKNPSYVDPMGNAWDTYDIQHPVYKLWEKYGDEFCPYQEEYDIFGLAHLQGAMQLWIDGGISKTYNVPESFSTEQAKKLFWTAYKAGCKGFTLHRKEGGKKGILDFTGASGGIVYSDAPKRPSVLPCRIYCSQSKDTLWAIIIGLLNNQPYEVFLLNLTEYSDKWKALKKQGDVLGEIQKVSSKKELNKYSLVAKDAYIDDLNEYCDKHYDSYTRIISLALRHGVKPSYLTAQLLKDSSHHLYSYAKIIARVLKKYILDGEPSTLNKSFQCNCETAEMRNIVFQSGCLTCLQCGYSRCS